MSEVKTVEVAAEENGLRLDRWFRRRYPALAHGRLEKLLRTGQVRLDGARAKASARVSAGQRIRVPPLGPTAAGDRALPAKPRHAVAERDVATLRALVLYRDDDVIVINKPPGLAVQGGSGVTQSVDSMLDGLRFDAPERPRLVHRLDRDTSGALLLARSRGAAARLAEAFRARDARKIYWAVTAGVPNPAHGLIDVAIAKKPGRSGERVTPDEDKGRRAVTYYAVLERAGDRAAFVALLPVTGRTHQLRVHLAAIGTPVLGDGKYGGRAAFLPGLAFAKRLHLHARSIEIPFERRRIVTVAPIPAEMARTFAFFGFDRDDARDPFVAIDE